jgi:hypothetical protein
MPRLRRNYVEWESTGGLSAALFVGRSVGPIPKWTDDHVRDVVASFRVAQGHAPDLSHIAQGGIYTDSQDGSTVYEESTQILIYNTDGTPLAKWKKEMTELAEHLCDVLAQREVIVDVRDRNRSVWVAGVHAGGRKSAMKPGSVKVKAA